MCQKVPDRFAFTVFIPSALNLVRGGTDAPHKVLGKVAHTARAGAASREGKRDGDKFGDRDMYHMF